MGSNEWASFADVAVTHYTRRDGTLACGISPSRVDATRMLARVTCEECKSELDGDS
jgi:nitrate reductase cytochrome c-type subunit